MASEEPEGSEPGRGPPTTTRDLGPEAPRGARSDLDFERAHARAKLKAQMFAIESEPLRIGRFPILGRLGQGGMGTVFSAFDEELDRKIAVKVMRPSPGSDGSQGRDRMRREAQAMARLSHPNIVAVHEVGEVDEQVFIAMEFVRGMSLDAWLSHATRRYPEVLDVFRRAGRGLAAAHAADLVHRDFKPSNVMVGDDGQVKILDFGLARAGNEARIDPELWTLRARSGLESSSLTQTGTIMGTPAYMSPEQHRGDPATAKSDQWSFCVALYLALFGRHPFPTETMWVLIDAIEHARVHEPPREGSVPTWLRRVVLRGLALDPEQRYPSMPALLDALGADPGARRRRWITRGLALGVLFGGGFGVAQLAKQEPCPDGRSALRSAWDDERREHVAAALQQGSPHGTDTWVRVEPVLDAYAGAWIVGHDDACQAHRSGATSDLLYDLRLSCLSRSRSALDALVEVFEHADSTVVDKAVSAVASLPELSRCEDAQTLLASLEPPSTAIATEVASLRDRLARARAVEEAGRITESTALASEVLARAEQLPYLPLVAEALLRRGTSQLLAGEATVADESLGRAAWLAIDEGHDEVAAEAAARRLYVRSEQLGRPAEAELELPWARALVDRTDDDALLGLLLTNAAVVHSRLGDPAEARALTLRALELKRRTLSPDHPDIAQLLANLGHFERDLGDHALALQTLDEAVRVTEVALGPRHPHRALIATMRGTTLLERGRYDEARRELELAAAIYRKSLGPQAMPLYHVLHALGRLAHLERRWDDARRAFEDALALAEPQVGAEHPMLANTRLSLAELEAATGHVATAEAMGRAALVQLETALGPTHPYVANAWLRLGRLLLAAGVHDGAVGALQRAVETEASRTPPDPHAAAWARLWLARAEAAVGEPRAAIPAIERELREIAGAFPEDSLWRLEGRSALAEAWLEAGENAHAAELLATNEAVLAELRDEHDPELAWLRARLAHLRAPTAPQAETRLTLERTLAMLGEHRAYASEASDVRRWLHDLGALENSSPSQ